MAILKKSAPARLPPPPPPVVPAPAAPAASPVSVEPKNLKVTIQSKQALLRAQLFPNVNEKELWLRTSKTGFTTLPRAFPMLMVLMDELSPKKPISRAYLSLWCRSWDDPMISIGSRMLEVALESGFTGQRAENSLTSRLAVIEKLGFVRFAPGAGGRYSFGLIMNPYLVLQSHRQQLSDLNWNALLGRMSEIGADDLLGT